MSGVRLRAHKTISAAQQALEAAGAWVEKNRVCAPASSVLVSFSAAPAGLCAAA